MKNLLILCGCGLLAILFPIALIYGIILTIRRNRAHKELISMYSKAGFMPLTDFSNLENNSRGTPGKISHAMKLNRSGKDYFWLEKNVRTSNAGGSNSSSIETKREFHFPLKRSSDGKLIIAFGQKGIPKLMLNVVKKVLEFAMHDKMYEIDIPHDLRDSGIMAALTDNKNDSLYNLIDRETLDLILSAPSQCIVMLYAENDTAVIGYDFESRTVDPGEFWSLMKKIMRLPADI